MPQTKEPGKIEALGPAATAAILVLGATVSLLLWQNLRRQHDTDVEYSIRAYEMAVVDSIEDRLNGLYDGLRLRSELWAQPLSGDSKNSETGVEIFLHENPPVLALLHANPSWQIAGSEDGKKVLRQHVADVSRSQAAVGDHVWGPIRLPDGRRVFVVGVHMSEGVEDRGAIYAVFDAGLVLHEILDERAIGYGVAVSADGEELYRRPHEPQDGDELTRFAATEAIEARFGKPWTLSIWPTAELIRPGYVGSPVFALAVGLLASSLLSAAVHFGTLAWRRGSALQEANEAIARQIGEAQRTEHRLSQLSQELEGRVGDRTQALNETIVELETFNYSVSHDLRAPLGAIINFSAILGEDHADQLDTAGKEHLQRIVNSATAAVSMMDALLSYSRSGRTELHRVPLDMSALAREIHEEIAAAAPHLRGNIKIGDLPDAFADERMIYFVLTNLISNACKFVTAGEEPRVEVGGHEADDETVVYFVRDQGIGFDMRFADKLFKVFERLHATGVYPGHGVGLAIVARMVRRHGGQVWAEGAPGKGATFWFTIPSAKGGN